MLFGTCQRHVRSRGVTPPPFKSAGTIRRRFGSVWMRAALAGLAIAASAGAAPVRADPALTAIAAPRYVDSFSAESAAFVLPLAAPPSAHKGAPTFPARYTLSAALIGQVLTEARVADSRLAALTPRTFAPALQPADPLSAFAGSATVGQVLSGLSDVLKHAIEQFRNAARSFAIEAGGQANYALINAGAVFDGILDRRIDQLDANTRGSLGAVATLVNDVTTKADADLIGIGNRAQEVINTFPFANLEPQLRGATPQFIAVGRGTVPVPLHFTGNFPFAARSGFTPRLVVDTTQVQLTQNSTGDLEFRVPSNLLLDADLNADTAATPHTAQTAAIGAAANAVVAALHVAPPAPSGDVAARFGASRVQLVVPWEMRKWLIFHVRREHTYHAIIGRLPEVPGKITVSRTYVRTATESKPVVFNSGLRSDKHGGNDDHEQDFELKPDPGCQIVPGTESFTVASAGGDWVQNKVSADAAHVVYRVTTRYHRFDASGRVDFGIHATEQCPTQATSTDNTVWNPGTPGSRIDLRWGESRSTDLSQVATWKVQLDAFDGKHYETSAPGPLGPFATVRVGAGGGLDVVTADPATLIWP